MCGLRLDEMVEQTDVCATHQAVEASALASSSIAAMKATGELSPPRRERGTSMRNSRASCSASTISGGNSRPASMPAAAAASRGASARARSTQSAGIRWSIARHPLRRRMSSNPDKPTRHRPMGLLWGLLCRRGRSNRSSNRPGALALAPAAVRWRLLGGDPMQRATDRLQALSLATLSLAGVLCLVVAPLLAQTAGAVLEGRAAFGDWRADAPGTRRLIRPADLPPPQPAQSVANMVRVVHRTDETPCAPPGFAVNLFAAGLKGPRIIRAAPNVDIFVAESRAGRVTVLRPDGGEAAKKFVFASGLDYPFGIAFYPPGADPQWIYIAETSAVSRFPYRSGDTTPRGQAETVVPHLP